MCDGLEGAALDPLGSAASGFHVPCAEWCNISVKRKRAAVREALGCCLKDLVICRPETACSFIQSTTGRWLLLDPPSGAPSALIR